MLRLIACFVLLAMPLPCLWAQTDDTEVELTDLDLTAWDCLSKIEGSAKTQDGKERNRQKNRSPVELAGFNIISLDTAGFLQRAADYDRKMEFKRRRVLTPDQKEQLQSLEKEIVSLTGWLVLACRGVPESTNCRSEQIRDFHLELFAEPTDQPPQLAIRPRSSAR
jgi:hypothetical protein